MLADAYEDKYEKAILFSGDGDFVPLIYVKKKEKIIQNFYFEGNLSRALAKECDFSSLIDKKIVNKFFYKEVN